MDKLAIELLLEVGFIVKEEVGYSREYDFEFPHLKLDDLELDEFSGRLVLSRTSDGLLARGEFVAVTGAECSRCLDAFSQQLAVQFSELFTFPKHADEDTELVLPSNNKIDFAPILREYMILEFPISPICRVDCQGLCPICGVNRNEETCDCVTESFDPRLSVLKSLLDDE